MKARPVGADRRSGSRSIMRLAAGMSVLSSFNLHLRMLPSRTSFVMSVATVVVRVSLEHQPRELCKVAQWHLHRSRAVAVGLLSSTRSLHTTNCADHGMSLFSSALRISLAVGPHERAKVLSEMQLADERIRTWHSACVAAIDCRRHEPQHKLHACQRMVVATQRFCLCLDARCLGTMMVGSRSARCCRCAVE